MPQAGQAVTDRVYDDTARPFRLLPMQLKEFLLTLDRQGRGFEDAAAWFLLNDPVYRQQVKRSWLWQDWPGCWGRDCGIDLVAETIDGELWAGSGFLIGRRWRAVETPLSTAGQRARSGQVFELPGEAVPRLAPVQGQECSLSHVAA